MASPILTITRVAALGLLVAASACRTGSPALEPPGVEGFERDALLDVFSADGVRAVDTPRFDPVGEALDSWLDADAPVVAVRAGKEARAYPVALLHRYEAVNDVVGGVPVVVAYSPLTNAAVALDRRAGARALTFGISGKLYFGNHVLFDRQTTSLWVPALGAAVLGPLRSTQLEPVPTAIVGAATFADAFPGARVLSPPRGVDLDINPYPRYERRAEPLGSMDRRPRDRRARPMERVVGIRAGDEVVALRRSELEARDGLSVTPVRAGNAELVVLWKAGARSALDDASIRGSRDTGSLGVFEPRAGARRLTLRARGGAFVDEETGSTWTVLGVATAGPLRGRALEPVRHLDTFWFAWTALYPRTQLVREP